MVCLKILTGRNMKDNSNSEPRVTIYRLSRLLKKYRLPKLCSEQHFSQHAMLIRKSSAFTSQSAGHNCSISPIATIKFSGLVM